MSTSLPGKKSVGYDIGCEFTTTLKNSSVGPSFFKSGSRFCVPAFHGYSHEYDCQVKFHPNRIPGMGLEDLETMERIFSSSNQLASVIRYASPYRRRALIALFFEHWDEERYASLAQMLYNNYRQALDIITEKTPILRETMETLQISDQDLARYLEEEREYFVTLQDEDPEDLRDVLYVDALKKLATAQYVVAARLCSHLLTYLYVGSEPDNGLDGYAECSQYRPGSSHDYCLRELL